MAFPCDSLLPTADEALFRAVSIAAPAPVVFRWLCQLRAAPYSYDWLDNLGQRSPRHLLAGLEVLATGQRVMTIFRLVDFQYDHHLTLLLRQPRAKRLLGDVAVSYVVAPSAPGHCRLIAKLLVCYPVWSRGRVLQRCFAWGDLLMMRKQLLTLKVLAETQARQPD